MADCVSAGQGSIPCVPSKSMFFYRILAIILFVLGMAHAHRKAMDAKTINEHWAWTAGMFLTTTITLNFLLTTYGR